MSPPTELQRGLAKGFAKHITNPIYRQLFKLGFAPPGTAILETTGRRSGEARRTPVTNGLDGEVFWIVSEHGRRSAYILNLEHDPRVRILVGRTWREGTAHVEAGDDPVKRLELIRSMRRASSRNSRLVKLVGTDLMTVRVDLESAGGRQK